MVTNDAGIKDERFDVLGVRVSVTSLTGACEAIGQWIENKIKIYVCVAPVSTIIDCQDSAPYRDIVNAAGLVTPDGMPLVWLGRAKGHRDLERTYGPDLMLALCDYSQQRGYKHYFYGGTSVSLQRLSLRLKTQFPDLKILGAYAPGRLEINAMEEDEVIRQINALQPDILWIGLGSPKQDYWMARHRGKLDVPVLIGSGAAFDFLSGTKPQAPRWMQRSGLEWLFRLGCEPRRLWRRYLIGNSRFVFLLLRELFGARIKTS